GNALGAEIVAAAILEGGAQQEAVLRHHGGIAGAEVLQQPRAALDICEQERDGPGRQLSHLSVPPRPAPSGEAAVITNAAENSDGAVPSLSTDTSSRFPSCG